MRRRSLSIYLLATILFLSGAELARAQQPAMGPKVPVKLGVTGRPDQAALELAMRRGYFSEYGLDIQTVEASAAIDFVSSIGTNQIQVASGSPNAGLFNALNRGIDMRIVADWAHIGDSDGKGGKDGTVSLVVRADLMDSGAVKTVNDLKGRSLNMAAGRGQYADVFMEAVFSKSAIKMSDVERVGISFPDSLGAFASKRLDAGVLIEPLVTVATSRNMGHILVRAGEVDAGAQAAVVFISSDFAKQKDAATKFVAAYLRGVRDYRDAFFDKKNQDETIAVLTQHLSVKDPNVWKSAMPQHIDPNGQVNLADLKRQAAIYKAQGDIPGPIPDLDRYVDSSFAADATKLIGRR